ncbi:MAG: DUF2293 domain-containing protein [Pseudomonadota bacterium]
MKATTPRQKAIQKALRALIPHASYGDFAPIFEAAKAKHMRSLAPRDCAFLATVAYIRHQYTDYDDLLREGYDQDSARHFVLDDTNAVLSDWGATHFVTGDTDAVPEFEP